MKRADVLAAAAILVVAYIVRVAALGADPANWLSWSAGLYSDEGIYSADARLWVLYGQHMQGDFHSSVIAPLQNLVLLHVFRRHEISLIVVRMISVAFSMATLALYWLSLRLQHGARAALIGLALLSLSAPFVLYNRMALLEMPALFWIVAGYLGIAIAERWPVSRIVMFLLAGMLIGVAAAWKSTFILAAIPLLAYVIWRHKGYAAAAIVGFAAVIGEYYVRWYMPHQAELARAGHYYLIHQYLPHSLGSLWWNLHRGLVTGEDDGLVPYLVTHAGWLLIAAAIALWLQRRSKQPDTTLLLLWLAVPMAAMLFSSYTPSRYYIIFWPALVSVAAVLLGRLKTSQAVILTGAVLACDCAVLGLLFVHRTYTMRDDARILAKVLPKDAWIGGQFAPSLCLDNSLRSMYIQKVLANDPAEPNFAALPLTHVLVTSTKSHQDDPWNGHYGILVYGPAGLKVLPVGKNFSVGVYANKLALP